MGTLFALLVIILVNFISFTCLHIISRDFLKTRLIKYAQIWFICKCAVQNGIIYLFLTLWLISMNGFNLFISVQWKHISLKVLFITWEPCSCIISMVSFMNQLVQPNNWCHLAESSKHSLVLWSFYDSEAIKLCSYQMLILYEFISPPGPRTFPVAKKALWH